MAAEDKDQLSEMACTYAALILADDDVPVTADKIAAILKAANINFVEPFWPSMFARALDGQDIKKMLSNVGCGIASGAPASSASVDAAATAAPAAAQEKKEEPKPEPESDSEDDMGLDLFG